MDSALRLPPSVAGWLDPLIVCGTILAAYGALSGLPISDLMLAMLIVGALIVVMGLIEWMRTPWPATRYPLRASLRHAAITWVGTLVGFAIVLLAWDILAEYRHAYYEPFFHILPLILAATPFVAAVFIFASTRILGPSRHGDYQFGLLAFGRLHEIEWRTLRDSIIVWLIRGFFLPINFIELVLALKTLRGHTLELLGGPWVVGEYYLLIMLYALIIAAVIPGYLFGSRLMRTETKAVSHSWFGWSVTLACYSPFVGAFFGAWFDYNPGTPNPRWLTPWVAHLQSVPVILMLVGAGILLLTLIHLWGEAQFGLRSSNLANRGIITTGAYRFTRHPVYVSKCIAWLLIWMPFASGIGLVDDARLTVLWFGVCVIYGLRALAEEQLLASDPDYVAYALWMDDHGIFRKLGHIFPPLTFRWRLAYWHAHPSAHTPSASTAID